ncbi:MAG TPA: SagB family peptide dehydrogenase [Candidatus Limnocylindrales bacterium]|nr:SagB family peptide dehydrogenase [Candidatus Limnocylindrales bacterium]
MTHRGRAPTRQRIEVPRRPVHFRRCRPLVLYWQNGELVYENYALHTRISADPLVCSILHFCNDWKSSRAIASFLGKYEKSSVLTSLNQLCKKGMLERSNRKPDARLEAMESWKAWNPAAGFFHFSTKDAKFAADQQGVLEELKRRAKLDPMPLPLKNYFRAPRAKLPRRLRSEGEFPQILKCRRTWRKFGGEVVPLEALAESLELTFGIQGWVEVPGLGRAAMKTSPSGGDLHPIEAYVLVQRVRGLKRGLYHYNAARHELEWLRPAVSRKELERSLGNQWWFAEAAFFVLMTAVFGRTQWKYESPRAYRVVLAEAGHLGQTFCLTATWLGLAPFCTMAVTDTQWEKWLGIDGVKESILYVVGAGTRPTDTREAHLGTLAKGTASQSQK